MKVKENPEEDVTGEDDGEGMSAVPEGNVKVSDGGPSPEEGRVTGGPNQNLRP